MKVSILDVFSYLGVSGVTFNEGVYTAPQLGRPQVPDVFDECADVVGSRNVVGSAARTHMVKYTTKLTYGITEHKGAS